MLSVAQMVNVDHITYQQAKACLAVYPELIECHYKARIKDSKKVTEAIKRDKWRYEELPQSVKGNKSTAIDLPQLERLVQWKITHGHNRPFLPAMIRKNDTKAVKEVTTAAAKDLNGFRGDKDTVATKVLDTLCRLTGVGPATATLIVSVYAPDEIPFFSDEVYEWLIVPQGDVMPKLKYDKKEYLRLFDAVRQLRARPGLERLSCSEIEKVAFVVVHVDLLSDEKVKELIASLRSESDETILPEDKDWAANSEDATKPGSQAKPRKRRKRGASSSKTSETTSKTNNAQRKSKRTKR
jgi:hypothetical protein